MPCGSSASRSRHRLTLFLTTILRGTLALGTVRRCPPVSRVSALVWAPPRLTVSRVASATHPLRRTLCCSAATAMSSALSCFKRAKLETAAAAASSAVIGTHSGTFQADEAMGVWMLRQTPAFRNAPVVRSRDPQVLEGLDIVIDVGGVYDHSERRYDHHQKGYEERFQDDPDRCTKLSASGLVYRHYGREVLQAYYPDLPAALLETAYAQLYTKLLEALDAIDTGVEAAPEGVRLRYKDSTGLASRVARLNPRWNEEGVDPDERFAQAVELCGSDFMGVMIAIVESDIPAREIVEKSLLERFNVDESGEIICLESGGLPWKNHLYDLEKVHGIDPLIKFVLYTDQANMWRVQAVTVEGMAFENRLSLPEEWRGLRDAELKAITQITGSRFVHAAGFIGGNDTKEGALKMAKEALTKAPLKA